MEADLYGPRLLRPHSEEPDDGGDEEEGHPCPEKQPRRYAGTAHKDALAPHQSAYLPPCHADGLEESVVPDIPCHGQVQDVVDQKAGAQAGDKGNAPKPQDNGDRVPGLHREENILLLLQVHAVDEGRLLLLGPEIPVKGHEIAAGSHLRQLVAALVIEGLGHVELVLRPVALPDAGDFKLPLHLVALSVLPEGPEGVAYAQPHVLKAAGLKRPLRQHDLVFLLRIGTLHLGPGRRHDIVPVHIVRPDAAHIDSIVVIRGEDGAGHGGNADPVDVRIFLTFLPLLLCHAVHDRVKVPACQADILEMVHVEPGDPHSEHRKEHKGRQGHGQAHDDGPAPAACKRPSRHPADDSLIVVSQHRYHLPSRSVRPRCARCGPPSGRCRCRG